MTSSHAADAGQGLPGRRRLRRAAGRPSRRWARTALVLVALLVLCLGLDAWLVAARLDRVDVQLADGPGDADGRTWVLVGVDSRAHLPAGTPTAAFGSTDDVPGSRADVVVVVHQTDAGTTVLSVPRDLLVDSGAGPGRLALTWLDGPQATVDALCALGIPTDHLVTVDLAGFAAVVDAAGGLDVDVPEPVRDPTAGLELTTAGTQHVDGVTALAMVRSRHPEHLVDGVWVPAPVDPDGRASAAGAVLAALHQQAQDALLRPWRLQSLAWTAAGAVAVDDGTSATDLAGLARADVGEVRVLPAGDPLGSSLVRPTTPATTDAVAAAGLTCSP